MVPRLFGLRSAGLAACAAALCLPVHGDTMLSVPVSGTSAAGNPVSFMATLSASGSTLTIVLANVSQTPTKATADVLSSFYFDVFQDGVRPTLSYASGAGQVYQVRRNGDDLYRPGGLPAGATDLRALAAGAGTWQFRSWNTSSPPGPLNVSLPPKLGFGIGTVGNSAFNPNGFFPLWVDQADYTLYSTGTFAGIDPVGNLANRLLVKGTATFAFTGLDPQRPVDFGEPFVFGLGTTPDSMIVFTPEPFATALLVPGLIALLIGRLIRRHRGPEPPRPRPGGTAAA